MANQRAAAEKWLAANPTDPRSAAVKKKLETMPADAPEPLPTRLAQWAEPVAAAAKTTVPKGVTPEQWGSYITAVIDRESNGKNIDVHADGHGHGLMGIDDRYHDFGGTPEVADPAKNIAYGAAYLRKLYNQTDSTEPVEQRLRVAADAFNAGPKAITADDPDAGTTGGNYGTDVLARMTKYAPVAAPAQAAAPATAAPQPVPTTSTAMTPEEIRAKTAISPSAILPPLGRSVSTVSPPTAQFGRPTRGPLDPDPRDADAIAEDAKHGLPANIAHYGAKLLPTVGAMGGGALAGVAGLPAGPGAVATGALGAGAGAGAGRYAQIGVDKMLGYPTMDPATLETAKQVLKEAALTTAFQGTLGGTGLAAGAAAPKMAEGRMRDMALGWAKMQGALSPAEALAIKGTNLETLSPDVMQALIDQSVGGTGAVPAAGALADKLRGMARTSASASPLLTGHPLQQMDESTMNELLAVARGGGENTPAAATALAQELRRRAQLSIAARKAAAVAPGTPPDMGAAFNAEAQAARLGRQLPTAEAGADAMTNLPDIASAARGANLAPLNQEVIDAIRGKLSGGANLPPAAQKLVANLSPADKAKVLQQLGIHAPDDEAVQTVFDNLRSNVSVAGDPSFQAKATGLLDAASRSRSNTDQLQEARDAIARATAVLGPRFAPADANALGAQSRALADQGQLVRAARDRATAATEAGNVRDAFGANKDPLFYESQANMLDDAAAAGKKAQVAQAELEAARAEPGGELQYNNDARSLDAFANANTKRGLQRDAGGGVMSVAALAGNRFRHALAENSPWSASAPVPMAANAARALETEALSRGLPAVDTVLRGALQSPNNPAASRATMQALAAYLYNNQQGDAAPSP